MTSSSNNMNKPLRWSTQHISTSTKSARIQKRSKKSNNSSRMSGAQKLTANSQKKKLTPGEEIDKLKNELDFTYDSLDTITVYFKSLHHAYDCSKPELEKQKTATRLCEMEKELLTAYDDLGLQVTHLERKIKKYETRIIELKKQQEQSPIMTEASCSPKTEDLRFVSSPCSSTDSYISENTFQLPCQNFQVACEDNWMLPMAATDFTQPLFYDNCMPIQQEEYEMKYFVPEPCQQQQQIDFSILNFDPTDITFSYPMYPM